jgi:hypothetical protein
VCATQATDASIAFVAVRCAELHTLDVSEQARVTDASVRLLVRHAPQLRRLECPGCANITERGGWGPLRERGVSVCVAE